MNSLTTLVGGGGSLQLVRLVWILGFGTLWPNLRSSQSNKGRCNPQQALNLYTPAILYSVILKYPIAGADLGILSKGGFRVQVRGNFHILTSQKKNKKTSEGGG